MRWGRGNRKIIADYKKRDFYNFYSKKYKSKAVNYKLFWDVWGEFIDLKMQLIIYNNVDFNMPRRFGSLGVNIMNSAITVRKDGRIITRTDFGATNKLWREMYPELTEEEIKSIRNKPRVFYTNEDSGGKIAKFVWDRSTCNFKYHSHYKFVPVRKWKRKLAEYIKQSKTLYYYERVKYGYK